MLHPAQHFLGQEWLHNLQGSGKHKNAGPLIQKLLRISRRHSKAPSQAQGQAQAIAHITCLQSWLELRATGWLLKPKLGGGEHKRLAIGVGSAPQRGSVVVESTLLNRPSVYSNPNAAA